jgi:hypothetical protein
MINLKCIEFHHCEYCDVELLVFYWIISKAELQSCKDDNNNISHILCIDIDSTLLFALIF